MVDNEESKIEEVSASIRAVQEEQLKIRVELLEREHRIIPAFFNYFQNRSNTAEYRNASLKGLIWCLAHRFFTSSVVITVAGLGIVGGFLAWQANVLLWEQNARINIQSHLIEAERRATLIFELSGIMEEISKYKSNLQLLKKAEQMHNGNVLKKLQDTPEAQDPLIQEKLRQLFTLDDALTGRIAALSLSLRPYYYVDYSTAVQTKRELEKSNHNTLSNILSATGEILLPSAGEHSPKLINRPLSPERGQLLSYLLSQNVNLLPINNAGASFENADLENRQIYRAFFPAVSMNGSSFRNSTFSTVRFGTIVPTLGPNLANSDFTCARFLNTWFGPVVISGAKFAHVDLSTFRVLMKGDVVKGGESVIFADNLWKADLTNARLHNMIFPVQSAPWLKNTSLESPIGFIHKEWIVEKAGHDKVGRELVKLKSANPVAYEREKYCS